MDDYTRYSLLRMSDRLTRSAGVTKESGASTFIKQYLFTKITNPMRRRMAASTFADVLSAMRGTSLDGPLMQAVKKFRADGEPEPLFNVVVDNLDVFADHVAERLKKRAIGSADPRLNKDPSWMDEVKIWWKGSFREEAHAMIKGKLLAPLQKYMRSNDVITPSMMSTLLNKTVGLLS